MGFAPRPPYGIRPRSVLTGSARTASAVSAVFTVNYQRRTALSPHESSTGGGVANEKQRNKSPCRSTSLLVDESVKIPGAWLRATAGLQKTIADIRKTLLK